ncbi:MAG: hypothetical protein D4S02_05755 [Rhodocyclaceae bacterium]|nr:MAG: hypothetical protein D4S02_05755 [Rhodocyclaceae bacterium]
MSFCTAVPAAPLPAFFPAGPPAPQPVPAAPPPGAFFPAAPKLASAAAPPAPPAPITAYSLTIVTPTGTVQVPFEVKTFSAGWGDGIWASAERASVLASARRL